MAYKIIWSVEAMESFEDIVSYLKLKFTSREVERFVGTTNRRLLLLQRFPQTFSPTAKTSKRRKAVIHKRTILFYKIRERKKEVELLLFFDTRQNPNRLRR